MANILIMTPSLVEEATLTVSDEDAETPITNLQKVQPTDIWQTLAVASVAIDIDLGSTVEHDTYSVLYSNISSDGTWRIRAASSTAALTSTSPTFDSGTITFWPSTDLGDWDRPHSFHHQSTGITARYLRIDITDTGNSDGVLRAGRLVIAKAWQPIVNMSNGWELGFIDTSIKTPLPAGQVNIRVEDKKRTVGFRLTFATETDMLENGYEIARLRGGSKDIQVCLDPDATAHLHKFLISGTMRPTINIANDALVLYQQEYRIEELL